MNMIWLIGTAIAVGIGYFIARFLYDTMDARAELENNEARALVEENIRRRGEEAHANWLEMEKKIKSKSEGTTNKDDIL